jgi:hypothetical protein
LDLQRIRFPLGSTKYAGFVKGNSALTISPQVVL